MKTYKIWWDVGYGPSEGEVEAESIEEAEALAYEAWREEAESHANYGVGEPEY